MAGDKDEKLVGKKRPATATPQKGKAKEEKKGKEAPAKKQEKPAARPNKRAPPKEEEKVEVKIVPKKRGPVKE